MTYLFFINSGEATTDVLYALVLLINVIALNATVFKVFQMR